MSENEVKEQIIKFDDYIISADFGADTNTILLSKKDGDKIYILDGAQNPGKLEIKMFSWLQQLKEEKTIALEALEKIAKDKHICCYDVDHRLYFKCNKCELKYKCVYNIATEAIEKIGGVDVSPKV